MFKIDRNIFIFRLWHFINSVEDVAIFVGLSAYLQTFSESSFLHLGIAFSCSSFADLVSSVFYGRIIDKTGQLKKGLLVSTFFSIVGSLLYFLAVSPWMIIAARFSAGLYCGIRGALMGQLGRYTPEKKRSSEITKLVLAIQFGVISGPVLNIIFSNVDFYMGGVHVTPLSVIGLVMTIVACFTFVMIAFGFDQEMFKLELQRKGSSSKSQSDESYELKEKEDINNNDNDTNDKIKWKAIGEDLCRVEVFVILVSAFMFIFVQAIYQTCLIPITTTRLGWTTVHNSILIMVVGVTRTVSVAAMTKLTYRVSDRYLLLGGTFADVLSGPIFIIFLFTSQTVPVGTLWVAALLCTDIIFQTILFPYLHVPQLAILSKITMKETSAFNQSILSSVRGLAWIIGPILTSPIMKSDVMLGITNIIPRVIAFVAVALCFKRFRSRTEESGQKQAIEDVGKGAKEAEIETMAA